MTRSAGNPRVTRLLVLFLRHVSGKKTQAEFGRAACVDQSEISRLEEGLKAASEGVLRRMAAAAGLPWAVVVHLRRLFDAVLSAAGMRDGTSEGAEAMERAILDLALLAVGPCIVGAALAAPRRPSPAEARREARVVWAALTPLPDLERRRLLDLSLRSWRAWALAVEIGEASVAAAADDTEKALELAELACSIAGRVEEEPGFCLRLQGHCLSRRANAWRVANDFDRAEEDFARAWELWRAGADAEPPLLAEWQMLSLEASLRQEQHLFPEALDLLDRAKAAAGGDRTAEGRILLQRELVYERMGDVARALTVLAEAAGVIESCGDPRLVFLHRFKTALNLVHLGRFAEAAALWPLVLELAAGQGKKLEQLRVRWVEGRLRAGLGERLEAMVIFVEVQREFTRLRLPYDAAQVSLELAVLWLEAGRTVEVRELALEMAWIFKAQKIAREALAALRLFCDAAERDAVTLALARKVWAQVEEARRSAPRPERRPGGQS
jgi:tetratricopeptide (TPR) repeat protein